MKSTDTDSTLTGFSSYLATKNILNEKKIRDTIHAAASNNQPFISQLIQTKYLHEKEIALAISDYFDIPFLDLNTQEIKAIPEKFLQTTLVKRNIALPLYANAEKLTVAIIDPTIPELNELTFFTGLRTRFVIVEASKLTTTITSLTESEMGLVLNQFNHEKIKDTHSVSNEKNSHFDSNPDATNAPIVSYVQNILFDAIKQNASDIHFEPFENVYRIRFRLDGLLKEIANQPIELANYISTRLKVMAQLDISERRIPQDGRFTLSLPNKREIDFRVNTCPTIHGEKIVLRILEYTSHCLHIAELGMSDEQQKHYLNALNRSQGMILVTGPTGSGKTVTLYNGLNVLNVTEKNISTVEDPVEIQLAGINQVIVNRKTGLTFANSLRAFLRQDPDIIMVGEIRDLETADIAIKASQTGHLVLSTLHTNNAPETLIRLMNMGVAAYNIASAISLIVAQRLVRRLCENCKQTIIIPQPSLISQGFDESEIKQLVLYGPGSCELCHDGYKGRIGIYEVLPISEAMRELILNNANTIDIAKQAKHEGIATIRESGLKKVREGITTLDEIYRVT